MKTLVVLILLFAFGPSVFAADTTSVKASGAPKPRKNVWSIGLTGNRHSLKSGDSDEFLGNSAAVQLGTGRVAESWYATVSLDVILGPYEPARQKQVDADFVGTGLTVWSGFSAQTLDLRSQAGGYGFALGVSYADIIGRSQGRNRRAESCDTQAETKTVSHDTSCDDRNATLIGEYSMRVTNLTVQPAIFFSWLASARPEGNTPDLLTTRLEGTILTVGLAIPVLSHYQAKYETIGSEALPAETISQKGVLRGYSLVVALTALLGT
jgi:hypothetical protein